MDLQQREKGPHIGLFCNQCNAWVCWIPRHSKNRLKIAATESSPPPAPEVQQQMSFPEKVTNTSPFGCAHCADLQRLTHELEGIKRELTVVLRCLIYGPAGAKKDKE